MSPDTVTIVVDPDFGGRLEVIAHRLPVWICATPANLLAALAIRETLAREGVGRESDVTTFTITPQETPEEMVISRLLDVDLHHPDWLQLEIYGVNVTPGLRQELAEYGVTQYQQTESGFTCSRVQNLAA